MSDTETIKNCNCVYNNFCYALTDENKYSLFA